MSLSRFKKGNIPWNKGIADVVLTCPICKKKFNAKRWRRRIYCSRSCHTKSRHQKGLLKQTKESRTKISQKLEDLWKNPEYRNMMITSAKNKKRESKEDKEKRMKAVLKSLNRRPTGLERKLIELTKKYNLPYRYVGDGNFFIEYFNPDFINCNGEKIIIETYSDYWHNLPDYVERDKRRIETYKKYGYKTLILWGSDFFKDKNYKKLKDNWEENVLNKIKTFTTIPKT